MLKVSPAAHALAKSLERIRVIQGGVIMDVVTAEQVSASTYSNHDVKMRHLCFEARIAEEAGACAVMALERVPADIRATGGVARMVCFLPSS